MARIDAVFINLDMYGKRSITITRNEISDFSTATTVTRLIRAIVDKEGGNVTGCHLNTMAKPMVERRDGVEMTMADYNISTNAQLFAQLRLLGGAMPAAATTVDLELTIEGRGLNADRLAAVPGISGVRAECDYFGSRGCGNVALRCRIECGGFTFCADCMASYLKQQVMAARTTPQLPDQGSTACQSRPNCVHNRVRNDETGNVAMQLTAVMANLSREEERQVASRFFANNQAVKVCPNRDCGMFVYTDGQQYRVRCPECRSHEWCFVCRQPWRDGSSQTVCGNEECKNIFLALWNQLLANTEYATVSRIDGVPTTRKCPNPQCFSMPIEYAENCKHIQCEVCRENFCLSCLRRKEVSGSCPLSVRCETRPIQNITRVDPTGWTSG